LTVQLALCWVHEYRHYKKLTPRFLAHCHLLEQFVILPMVLQIRETMVLQRVEREGKGSPPHF